MGAVRSAHDAGQQPQTGIQQHQRRRLAARQNVIADADFLGSRSLDHALIQTLIAAAEQNEAGSGRPTRGVRLGQ